MPGDRLIPLTRGAYAVVCDEDYEALILSNWHLHDDGKGKRYAVRNVRLPNGRRSKMQMHREIVNMHGIFIPPRMVVDHWDGDGLNNRNINLFVASPGDNNHNRDYDNPWGYRGVTRLPSGRFQAQISYCGSKQYLGVYPTPAAAGSMYDVKARELFGRFAITNEHLRMPAPEEAPF